MTPYAAGDPGAQQRVADLVAAAAPAAPRRCVAGGIRSRAAKHRADQRLGRQPVGAGVADRDQHQQVGGERAGGVGDLGELRAVQRPVGDHAEHPAGRQQRAHLGRAYAAGAGTGPWPPSPMRRTGPPTPDQPVAGRPGVGDLERGHRRALGVGEHHRAAQRVGEVEPVDHVGGHLAASPDSGQGVPSASRPRLAQRGRGPRGRGSRSAARRRRRAAARGRPARTAAACSSERHAAPPRA